MHMICKGQIRWLKKGDVTGQVRFVKRASTWPRDAHHTTLTGACTYLFATRPANTSDSLGNTSQYILIATFRVAQSHP
jgi:hypothetical protein